MRDNCEAYVVKTEKNVSKDLKNSLLELGVLLYFISFYRLTWTTIDDASRRNRPGGEDREIH